MELDDWKRAWAAHGAKLERSLRINERLLRELLLRKVRVALAPYAVWRAIEVVIGGLAVMLVMRVLIAHATEPRYLVVVGALAVFAIGMTALCGYLLVGGLAVDYGGPVTAIQRAVERLRLAEYRGVKWALLGGVVLWLPAALVLLELASGVDFLARVNLAWLVANLAVGAAVLAAGLALARRHVERPGLGPRARRIVDAMSGRALRRASAHLAELAAFERDEPAAP
jgi:hypothetical protein